jgi:hypothetical protein
LVIPGTWGKEMNERVVPQPMKSTMAAELFDQTPKYVAKEMENNKFAKFVRLLFDDLHLASLFPE